MPQYKICFLGYKQLTSIAQQVVPTLPFDDCEIQIVDCLPDTLPEIVSCTLNTDYNFPDTTRKLPRYQAVFEVVHY